MQVDSGGGQALLCLFRSNGTDSLRAREKMGSQAEAPAPLIRKSLCITVGQALPPANSELTPIFLRALRLRESVPFWIVTLPIAESILVHDR
jgi:hypothetical protein